MAEARDSWGSETNPCTWTGVECSEVGTEVRVIKLSMHGFGLTGLPPSISRLSEVWNLVVSSNSLASLPDTLCSMTALVGLDVSQNHLPSLPDCLGDLVNLQALWAYSNRLASLPQSLTRLKGLYGLVLFSNRLVTLPDPLPAILEGLYLADNHLESLPESLSSLAQLKFLTLTGNPLIRGVPDLSRTSLTTLSMSQCGLASLPELPLGTLELVSVNGNNLTGTVQLCGRRIVELNLNSNPGLAAVAEEGPGGGACLPSLRSINAAGANLTSVGFLRGSLLVTDVDLSDNPFLGNAAFDMARTLAWPRLGTLKVQAVGATLTIGQVLGSVFPCSLLLSLDVSRNPGIAGEMSTQGFNLAAGGFFNGTLVSFGLFALRLDGLSIGRMQSNIEVFFKSLRILSMRDMPLIRPDTSFLRQGWAKLEQLDLTGSSNLAVDASSTVQPFPGTPDAVDLRSNSTCMVSLLGGTVAQYAVTADPSYSNHMLCQCLGGHYGEPWNGGCLACPRGPAGDDNVRVDCLTVPGTMRAEAGWLSFDRGRLIVLACPTDSIESPCQISTLGMSIRNASQWDTRVVRPGLNLTTCVDGYRGELCSQCAPGFFRVGRSCHRCGAAGLSWLSPLVSVLVITALGVKTVITSQTERRSGVVRVLTLHAQLIAALPDMSIKLVSKSAGLLIRSLSSGSSGFVANGLECGVRAYDGFYGPFAKSCLLPLEVLVGSAWITLLSGWGAP